MSGRNSQFSVSAVSVRGGVSGARFLGGKSNLVKGNKNLGHFCTQTLGTQTPPLPPTEFCLTTQHLLGGAGGGSNTPPPSDTTDQGNGKGRSVVRPMGTAAYGGKGQGKGKGRGEGRLGQGGRGRSKGGEKPIGTTGDGGKGSKGRAANGDRPVGATSCRRDHHTMASCQNPPLRPGFHSGKK